MITHRPDLVDQRPLPTTRYDDATTFSVPKGSIYIAARRGEERAEHAIALQERSPGVKFLEVIDQSRSLFMLAGSDTSVALRSPNELTTFWEKFDENQRCFIDITGLDHSVWSALISVGLDLKRKIEAVYVEPASYKANRISVPSRDIFDLTESFEGLYPLPGLARLASPRESEFWFIPLLGFEGRRFSYMKDQVAPIGRHTIPVIGVPGFQPEFVGYAYHGNQEALREDDVWQDVAYATANCPYSLFYLLEDLSRELPGRYFKVATIGTKPHSLGAVLFARQNPTQVEILYDHPVRKKERTAGNARLLIYHLHSFSPTPPDALAGTTSA